MKLNLLSDAFQEGDLIPQKYTCEGDNISPPLTWPKIPTEAESLALIAEDPDAPNGTWVHWLMYNIPARETGLPEQVPQREQLDNGALQGINDFKKIGYGGPCPPQGTHRYYFHLFALDQKLDLPPAATRAQLEKAMKGHIVAQGEIMGKYQR